MSILLPRLKTSNTENLSALALSTELRADEDRVQRVAAAVMMVENGCSKGGKVSVRKAARVYGIPKSTVHRYIQASRGIDSPQRRRIAKRRTKITAPQKCNISFLLNEDKKTLEIQSCTRSFRSALMHPHLPFGKLLCRPNAFTTVHQKAVQRTATGTPATVLQ